MRRLILLSGTTLAALLLSFSCTNAPIFAAIEQEVKLKPASVSGVIRSAPVAIGSTLYVANGRLFQKTKGNTEKWEEVNRPGYCTSIATDGTTLYGTFNGSGYQYNSSGWTPITGADIIYVSGSSHIGGGTATVFAIDAAHKLYTVSGTTATFKAQLASDEILRGAVGGYCITNKQMYAAVGAVPAGAPSGNVQSMCAGPGANSFFVASGNTLYCYSGGSWKSCNYSSAAALSITYLEAKKLVLIATGTGYREIKLNDAAPDNLSLAFEIQPGSAQSSIPASIIHQYYNSVGKWRGDPIYAVSSGTGYSIYAGALDESTRNTGLWGFYNPGQLEWNRE